MTPRHPMLRSLTGLLVLLSSCKGATQEMPTETVADVRATIVANNAKFMAYMAAGQADSLAALYHDDAMLLISNSPASIGKTAIRAGLEQLFISDVRLTLTTADVSLADSIAVERGTYTLLLRDKADTTKQTAAEDGNYLVEWRKRDGIWKLHWDITAALPSATAPSSAPDAK